LLLVLIPDLAAKYQQGGRQLRARRRLMGQFPGDRHTVDENASKTEPAKLLAVFVVNTDEKELLTPYKK
jgi:hypothetical protein